MLGFRFPRTFLFLALAASGLAPAMLRAQDAPAPEAAGNKDEVTVFGSRSRKEGALIGIFYDLKQTQKREETGMTTGEYDRIVAKFLNNGWPEEDLSKYFRATRPLYADRIFIPKMWAEHVPRIFNVDNYAKGRLWLVHYKGQVKPPHAGTFRFVGFCDDFIAVAINGKNVLVNHWPGMNFPGVDWRAPEGIGPRLVHGSIMNGDWFELKEDEIVDIDIAIGEIPGVHFSAWLFYQEQGKDYPPGPDGVPLLPVFQVGDAPMPELKPFEGHKSYPAFPSGADNWKPVQ